VDRVSARDPEAILAANHEGVLFGGWFRSSPDRPARVAYRLSIQLWVIYLWRWVSELPARLWFKAAIL
jgi:hypothetical protein